jgi:hypothetical protein
MTKIVINACYGAYSISREAVLRAREISGDPNWGGACIKGDVSEEGWAVDGDYGYTDYADVPRADPVLVQVVEELGERANGQFAELSIIDLPSGTLYRITEYDGYERIETRDISDWRIA